MTTFIPRCATALLATALLAACSHHASPAATVVPSVAVTTAMPAQRRFHDRIEAFGTVVGDPRYARSLGVAHGGEVTAVLASAGQFVRAGAPLLRIAPDPATRQAWTQTRNALAQARAELARTAALAGQRLATRAQLVAARKAVSDARAALDAQRALGAGSAVDVLKAPAAGVVTAVHATIGERFAANVPLLGFVPAGDLLAQLGVPANAAARIAAGMPATWHAVYGDGGGQGRVSMAGRAVDPQTHFVPVQVALAPAAAARLMPGTALEAWIDLDAYTAWAVPRGAVLHGGQGDYLFQLDHGKARRVDVRLRQPTGDTVGVLGPLDPALPVIVQGAYELHDGMAVREQTR